MPEAALLSKIYIILEQTIMYYVLYLLMHSKVTTRMALNLEFVTAAGLLESILSRSNYDPLSLCYLNLEHE